MIAASGTPWPHDEDDPMARGASSAQGAHNASPAEPMTEIEFHDRSMSVAASLLNEVSTKNGKLKGNVDMVRVEKALSTARAVIEATGKARASMRQARDDQIFESAVIAAAQTLERPQQEAFMVALQESLATLSEAAG